MPLVTTRLAAQLQRRTAEHTYTDTATYISPANVSTTGVLCSFTDMANAARTAYADFQLIDSEIRLSSLTPEHGGRFTITKRFGATVTSKTYEIKEVINRGAFGFICYLKETIT